MSPAASCTSPATLAACFLASPKARLKSEFWVRVSAIGYSLGKSVAEQRSTGTKVRQTGTFMASRGCSGSQFRRRGLRHGRTEAPTARNSAAAADNRAAAQPAGNPARHRSTAKKHPHHGRELMFQHRASQFDPRVASIAGHLRAIEKELGVLGKSAGRRASSSASAAGNQILEAIWPILNEISDSFRRGQRVAVDEAASFGNEAVKRGAQMGSDALGQLADQAKRRPLVTLAVAIGVGVLIGAVARRN